jgi:hypothetical protein
MWVMLLCKVSLFLVLFMLSVGLFIITPNVVMLNLSMMIELIMNVVVLNVAIICFAQCRCSGCWFTFFSP